MLTTELSPEDARVSGEHGGSCYRRRILEFTPEPGADGAAGSSPMRPVPGSRSEKENETPGDSPGAGDDGEPPGEMRPAGKPDDLPSLAIGLRPRPASTPSPGGRSTRVPPPPPPAEPAVVPPPGRTAPRAKRKRGAPSTAQKPGTALRGTALKGTAIKSRAVAGAGAAGAGPAPELERMQVVLRIRPMPPGLCGEAECIAATDDLAGVTLTAPLASNGYKVGERSSTHAFSRVFPAATSQAEFFEGTARPLVDDFVTHSGRHFVLFAYGVTNSGKTHTVDGPESDPGLVTRSLQRVFEQMGRAEEESRRGLRVAVANYEVYNEQLYDLLSPGGGGGGGGGAPRGRRAARPLRLKEDGAGHVFIGGLTEVDVGSTDAALAAVRLGSSNRRKADNALNHSSSRSHSVFTVTLLGGDGARLSKLSFVDLAGSERASRTNNRGARLREAISINSSLMTLGRCLQALRKGQAPRPDVGPRPPPVIPYRESKITHLFRDALHGWGRVTLVTCVSPAPAEYDETAHVLRYAAIASHIQTAASLPEAPEAPPAKRRRASAQGPAPAAQDPPAPAPAPAAPATARRDRDRDLAARLHAAEEAREDLALEVNHLRAEVVERERRLARAEAEVREEVTQEMEEAMREMQDEFHGRMGEGAPRPRRPRAAPPRARRRPPAPPPRRIATPSPPLPAPPGPQRGSWRRSRGSSASTWGRGGGARRRRSRGPGGARGGGPRRGPSGPRRRRLSRRASSRPSRASRSSRAGRRTAPGATPGRPPPPTRRRSSGR